MIDLIIKNGNVVDGVGTDARIADIAIAQGRIVEVAESLSAKAVQVIDANGLLVTPGFIDLHTHLDGQVTWESQLKPNTGHGITTAVIGNCGVGFAPCKPADRELLIRLMETVEDIPFVDLNKGLPWNWESYPDYLDALSRRQYNMDIGGLLPHSTLRTYVMGERALDGVAASDTERAELRRLTAEAIRAGALGFGSSTLTDQKTSDGRHIPSFIADEAEFLAMAQGMTDAGAGLLQVAFEFNEFPGAIAELEMFIRIAKRTRCPVTFSLKQSNRHPQGWRELLAISDRANSEGAQLHPQVFGRPTGAVMNFATSFHPFVRCPSYGALADLPWAERYVALQRPELRAKLIAEAQSNLRNTRASFDLVFPLSDPPCYEPAPEESLAARAQMRGISTEEYAYDYLLQDEGRAMLLLAGGNYADFNLDPSFEMLRNAHAVPGLGDGGAHAAIVCDASVTTYMLTHWTRDRTRGDRLSLPAAVKLITADAANVIGLRDRGVIRAGYKADLNVIDYDRLRLRTPQLSFDLPAGSPRLTQASEGYVATIVSGEVVHWHDRETEALPGRLVRGAQRSPQ